MCMFARIRLCDLTRIMMCTVKVKSELPLGGKRGAKVQSVKCKNTHIRDRQMLTIKYAMKIREEQHQHMLSPSLLLLLLYGIGKIRSETKCLLFIVEMDLIWAKNMNGSRWLKNMHTSVCVLHTKLLSERTSACIRVRVYVCAMKLEILSAHTGLNSDKKRIIRCIFFRSPHIGNECSDVSNFCVCASICAHILTVFRDFRVLR